jgi:hypothetical protein
MFFIFLWFLQPVIFLTYDFFLNFLFSRLALICFVHHFFNRFNSLPAVINRFETWECVNLHCHARMRCSQFGVIWNSNWLVCSFWGEPKHYQWYLCVPRGGSFESGLFFQIHLRCGWLKSDAWNTALTCEDNTVLHRSEGPTSFHLDCARWTWRNHWIPIFETFPVVVLPGHLLWQNPKKQQQLPRS